MQSYAKAFAYSSCYEYDVAAYSTWQSLVYSPLLFPQLWSFGSWQSHTLRLAWELFEGKDFHFSVSLPGWDCRDFSQRRASRFFCTHFREFRGERVYVTLSLAKWAGCLKCAFFSSCFLDLSRFSLWWVRLCFSCLTQSTTQLLL